MIGGGVVLLSSIFDAFDGAVARATGKESPFGAILDSTVDRLTESITLLGLLVFYIDARQGFEWQIILVAVTITTSYMVSYVRARAEGLGITCDVGIMQRPQRVVILCTGLIVGELWLPTLFISLVLISLLSTVTTIHRLIHTKRELEISSTN